jgi:hypothetical protein
MADLTVRALKNVIEKLPDNTLLKIRQQNGEEFASVEVGLIAYTSDNELLFLAEPDV